MISSTIIIARCERVHWDNRCFISTLSSLPLFFFFSLLCKFLNHHTLILIDEQLFAGWQWCWWSEATWPRCSTSWEGTSTERARREAADQGSHKDPIMLWMTIYQLLMAGRMRGCWTANPRGFTDQKATGRFPRTRRGLFRQSCLATATYSKYQTSFRFFTENIKFWDVLGFLIFCPGLFII